MRTQRYNIREVEDVIYSIPEGVFSELCAYLVPGHAKAFALIKEGVDNPQAFIEVGNILKDYLPKELLRQDIKTVCRVISKRFHLEHMTTT